MIRLKCVVVVTTEESEHFTHGSTLRQVGNIEVEIFKNMSNTIQLSLSNDTMIIFSLLVCYFGHGIYIKYERKDWIGYFLLNSLLVRGALICPMVYG